MWPIREPVDERYLYFLHPNRWHYDVLRALDYFRSASILTDAAADSRLGEAIEHVRSRRSDDGTWPLDWSPTGRVWFEVDDGQGEPSRWVTLRTMRVLTWWESLRLDGLASRSNRRWVSVGYAQRHGIFVGKFAAPLAS